MEVQDEHSVDSVKSVLHARWITENEKQGAELLGSRVVVPPSVLITHLRELTRRHAPKLLSRQDVQMLSNNLKQD